LRRNAPNDQTKEPTEKSSATASGTRLTLRAFLHYPPKFNAVAAKGTIVHRSLEELVKTLSLAWCMSLGEDGAIAELKKLGASPLFSALKWTGS
jgi:hypothetical protein